MMIVNYRKALGKIWPLLTMGVLFVLVGCASQPAEKPSPAPPEKTAQQQKMILNIDVSEDQETARVVINANQPLTYTAVKHQFPLGVVLYFPDTSLKGIEESYTPENSIVSTIQTSMLKRTRLQWWLLHRLRFS